MNTTPRNEISQQWLAFVIEVNDVNIDAARTGTVRAVFLELDLLQRFSSCRTRPLEMLMISVSTFVPVASIYHFSLI